jgi:hypothetical protein
VTMTLTAERTTATTSSLPLHLVGMRYVGFTSSVQIAAPWPLVRRRIGPVARRRSEDRKYTAERNG